MYNWRPVADAITQALTLGPIVFNSYINNLGKSMDSNQQFHTDDPKRERSQYTGRLPFTIWGDLTDRRNKLAGISQGSANVKPCTWEGITYTVAQAREQSAGKQLHR